MLQQFTSANDLHDRLANLKRDGATVGFVPTMGALHQGHMTLIDKAMRENDVVVCSIFVNPKQFNNPEDLAKYPRTIDEDLKLLDEHNCHMVFIPTVEEIYPEEVTTQYEFGPLAELMEGTHRPGHFNGMAIVVKRLFDITIPTKAYFGDKDYQQLVIVEKLVEMEQMEIDIIGCPISREPNGLAMSSRNKRLTADQKEKAAAIYAELLDLSNQFVSSKSIMDNRIAAAINRLNQLPDFEVEYLLLVDRNTLQEFADEDINGQPHLFAGVKVAGVRLIDNLPINV
jgi:pantoate--beta-alanine ligase